MTAAISKRKYGRFVLSHTFIEDYPTIVKRIMGKCIILRAEFMFIPDEIHYQAISDDFRTLEIGAMIPLYRWTIDGEWIYAELLEV